MISDLIKVIEAQGFMVEKFNKVKNTGLCETYETVEFTVCKSSNEHKCHCKEAKKSYTFEEVQRFCNEGCADKYIKEGDMFVIPGNFNVDEHDNYDEIDAENVRVIAVSVKPSKVVFNFERILFRHCIDEDYAKSGDFEETELGGYLKGKFQSALEKKLGVNVLDCSLLSKENVFEKDSEEYMPFFGERKNRIKTLLDDSDTWYWWLKTPHASNSTGFCDVYDNGRSSNNPASSSNGGVAPAFAVGKCI